MTDNDAPTVHPLVWIAIGAMLGLFLFIGTTIAATECLDAYPYYLAHKKGLSHD